MCPRPKTHLGVFGRPGSMLSSASKGQHCGYFSGLFPITFNKVAWGFFCFFLNVLVSSSTTFQRTLSILGNSKKTSHFNEVMDHMTSGELWYLSYLYKFDVWITGRELTTFRKIQLLFNCWKENYLVRQLNCWDCQERVAFVLCVPFCVHKKQGLGNKQITKGDG